MAGPGRISRALRVVRLRESLNEEAAKGLRLTREEREELLGQLDLLREHIATAGPA